MSKILLITGSLNQGGAEFQTLQLAKLLKQNGHEIKILALTNYQFYKNFVEEEKLEYEYFENSTNKFLRVLKTISISNSFKPDCIIAYTRKVSVIGVITKIFSFRQVKLLVSERTSLLVPKWDNAYFYLCRFADIITSNSVSKYEFIKDTYPKLTNKTYFIPNILSKQFGNNISINHDSKYLSSTFAYVGRISKEKNLVKLIVEFGEFNKRYHTYNLKIYGEAKSDSYFAELQNLVEELNLNDVVLFCGPTSNVNDVYLSSKAICLISEYEGFSNVLSEALSLGTPTIVSNISENKFLVKDGVNGFHADINQQRTISGAMEKVALMTVDEYHKMCSNNIMAISELMNEGNLYDIYKKLLKLN